MKIKNLLSAILAIALVVATAACNGTLMDVQDTDAATEETTQTTTEEAVDLGYSTERSYGIEVIAEQAGEDARFTEGQTTEFENETEDEFESVVSSTTTDFSVRDNFDRVIDSGDGFFFVRHSVETYYANDVFYGIVNSQGEFISELSKNRFDMVFEDISPSRLRVASIGENMFAFIDNSNVSILNDEGYFSHSARHNRQGINHRYLIFNADTGKFVHREGSMNSTIVIGRFHEGYAPISFRNRVYRMDRNGSLVALNIGGYMWPLSEGLFFVGNGLYNLNGELVVDLSRYDIIFPSRRSPLGNNRCTCLHTLRVENGQFCFEFRNPAGTRFHVTYNVDGDRLYDPEIVND